MHIISTCGGSINTSRGSLVPVALVEDSAVDSGKLFDSMSVITSSGPLLLSGNIISRDKRQ